MKRNKKEKINDKLRSLLMNEKDAIPIEEAIAESKMKHQSFNSRCYELLRKVPRGKVITYKALAQALKTKAYRAVGNAMNRNPHAPEVPCHRVINSNGYVGGFASGTKNKRSMLKSEGIKINNGKIDLSTYGFAFS